MKRMALLIFSCLLLFYGCSNRTNDNSGEAVKIIFDTDLGPDYDDVGALAFLHAMADSGKAEILATVSSNKHELVAPSIDVLNTWFGRASLPVGAPKGSAGNSGIESALGRFTCCLTIPIRTKTTSEVPDAVSIYRKLLNESPDKSVTIVTVGFLTNLSNLLKSEADDISPMNGTELVSRKVSRFVAMAGRFPEGREFNIYIDSSASEYVFENWPGEVIFTGFEIGWEIRTGLRLIKSPVEKSPVKDVFRISIPLSAEDSLGRMSWDEDCSCLNRRIRNRGFLRYCKERNNCSRCRWQQHTGRMTLNGKASVCQAERCRCRKWPRFIEDRMTHLPVNRKNQANLNI